MRRSPLHYAKKQNFHNWNRRIHSQKDDIKIQSETLPERNRFILGFIIINMTAKVSLGVKESTLKISRQGSNFVDATIPNS